MHTVATVLRSGGHYAADYVERIKADLEKHSPGVRLVCLSDCDVPCKRIPLIHNWPGWWSKIELFRPRLFRGHVLYLDLDTVIVGDIAPLFRDRFTALPDFYRPNEGIGSGVMAWRGGMSHLYAEFAKAPDRWMGRCTTRQCWGDQGFIQSHAAAERFGDDAQSAKIQGDRRKARVICFHGQPRPRDVGWDYRKVAARRMHA